MDFFKPLYKKHKHSLEGCFDTKSPEESIQGYEVVHEKLSGSFLQSGYDAYQLSPPDQVQQYTIKSLPGLKIISGALTSDIQRKLVDDATSTYLADPRHLTNLDLHGIIPRPIELFSEDGSKKFTGKHQLRWVTLGGQYDWTRKLYPSFNIGKDDRCPSFPEPLATFINESFGVKAEAAIVNFYSEGNTLSPHQDVAEQCCADLVSISLGCSTVFYAALNRWDTTPLPIILHSGDIVVMGGPSRYAWHGIGRVLANTSPQALQSDSEWAGWIPEKRININVRQMLP